MQLRTFTRYDRVFTAVLLATISFFICSLPVKDWCKLLLWLLTVLIFILILW